MPAYINYSEQRARQIQNFGEQHPNFHNAEMKRWRKVWALGPITENLTTDEEPCPEHGTATPIDCEWSSCMNCADIVRRCALTLGEDDSLLCKDCCPIDEPCPDCFGVNGEHLRASCTE